jgi:hypothetical protein
LLSDIGISPGLSTRNDIFASGDGGALWNNRDGQPSFVQHIPMNDRDYSFTIENIIPRPSPSAQLTWKIVQHVGDTFPGNPIIERVSTSGPDVKVTIPWHSLGISDKAVFARTIYLYWADGGKPSPPPSWYHVNKLKVSFNWLAILKSQGSDSKGFHIPPGLLIGSDDDNIGSYRFFVEVGGDWFFVNELFAQTAENGDILDSELGMTGDSFNTSLQSIWGLNKLNDKVPFIFVPPGDSFRVYGGGWEADGSNLYFGRLHPPNSACDNNLKAWLNDNYFTIEVLINGGVDDAIGQVDNVYNASNGFGVDITGEPGEHGHIATWVGPLPENVGHTNNPDKSFNLNYQIQKIQ